jgi:hypothetical protein
MNTTTAADRRLLNVQELDARPTFNSFRGTFIGNDLISHLITIDHDQSHFTYVSDYINAFLESKCFFEHFFPFYMGSHVTQDELVSFYEEYYCDFVEFFQMNHPDWNEYSHVECLQHFKIAFDIYDKDADHHSELLYRTYQTTPQTLEKPHFLTYSGSVYTGYGYFPDVNGDTTALSRRIGENGPFGYGGERFNLENYLQNGGGVDFYLEKGDVQFDIDRTDGSRYTRNFSLPELFLFENSFQREKEERKEAQKKQRRERELREFQALRRYQRALRANNVLTTDEWIRNTSQAFRSDTPSMIEIQAIFASQPLLPFQYRGLPVPRVNSTEYRNPVRDYNDDDDS